MATPELAAPSVDEARLENPGIVSVNERGSGNNDLAKKLLFIGVVLGALVVAGVFTFNKYRASQKAKEGIDTAQSKIENKPAQVGPKRDFAATPFPAATPSAAPVAMPVKTPEPPPGGCKDILITDGSGKPMMGANGLPIKVGCDGKLVPAIAGSVGAPAGSAGASQQGQPAAPKPPDRYAGDVVLRSPLLGNGQASAARPAGPQTPQDTMELIKSLLPRQAPIQQPTQPQPATSIAPAPMSIAPQSRAGTPGLLARLVDALVPAAHAQVPMAAPTSVQAPQQSAAPGQNQQGPIGSLLTPTATPKVQAANIGDRNMLISKGTQMDCALTVKLVNEVSGFASCVLSNNIYSDNGKVLLLERGSDLQGEYGAVMQQGQRRIFLLWERVKTPNGIVITLGSPAANGLGTMGLAGHLDNRWWDRIGAAFLLSFVKDAIAWEVARSSGGSAVGGTVYQNTARTGESMAERVLASTINIKPTIYKNQGDRASVYVARDLDFSSVYALRTH